MIQAAIFDLDGTLLNTLPSIAFYGNQALAKHGLPAIETEEYKYLVGEGAKLLVERMLAKVGADPAMFDAVYADYRAAYDAKPAYKTTYYDGILELLGAFQKWGIPMTVFSNKPEAQVEGVLEAFFPKDTFKVILGQQEGLARKPDPEGVFRICEELQVKPQKCMYIGDTATDMQTGKAAGCLTVGVSWGFRTIEELLDARAYAVAEKPMELLQLINEV